MKIKQGLIIISHFAENAGTTDYFINDLKNKKYSFFYLRHPLPMSGLKYSELIGYVDGEIVSKKKYLSPKLYAVKTIFEIIVNLWIVSSLIFTNQVKIIIAFGSFNAASSIMFKIVGRKIVFWGVDYSDERFQNFIINSIYKATETFACIFSDLVIQPTKSQLESRLKHHHLNKKKAIIVPNGITKIVIKNRKITDWQPVFVYIGSLSTHHGMKEFLDMIQKLIPEVNVEIFGSGEQLSLMKEFAHYKNNIIVHGAKDPNFINEYIAVSHKNYIGVAPYLHSGHVIKGDSLKIKEYVNLGLPYVSSDAIYITPELKKFGKIYTDNKSFEDLVTMHVYKMRFDYLRRQEIIAKLDWNYIFDTKLYPTLSSLV